MANSVDSDQTALGAVCSGSMLFPVSNARQLYAADDIFRCIFSWFFKG